MNPHYPSPAGQPAALVLAPSRRPGPLSRYFYVLTGVLALGIVLAGFARTYFLPLASGTFTGRTLLHVHGVTYSLWLVLAIVQPLLVQKRRTGLHRKLGMFGSGLALTMIVVGVALGITAARLQLLGGTHVRIARFGLILPLTDLLLFASCIVLALGNLKNLAAHKRWMVLATLSILPAAFGRIFPLLGITSFTPLNALMALPLQESLLLLGIGHDLTTRKKVHPVYKWGGAAIVIVHLVRYPLGNTEGWQTVAAWLIGS